MKLAPIDRGELTTKQFLKRRSGGPMRVLGKSEARNPGRNSKYAWRDMRIGEMKVGDRTMQSAANSYKRRHPGWDYRSEQVVKGSDDQIRIWRIA